MTRRRHACALLAALALVLLGSGCTRKPSSETLQIFAAASLTEAFEDLATRFEADHPGLDVQLSQAGSQALRLQIEQGARPDVFASANAAHLEALRTQGLVAPGRVFARNHLVIIVPEGNPAGIRGLADLAAHDRLVIGAPDVPVGAYTLELLERAAARFGADFPARVQARVASRELSVRHIVVKVGLGEAAAGIVYRTDAASAADRVDVVAIPRDLDVLAEYHITTLTAAPHPERARAFVDFVLSPAGRAALDARGFDTGPSSHAAP